MSAFLPILLIVVSVSIYQIGQKLLPTGINPWHAVIFYYLLALVITGVVLLIDRPSQSLLESAKKINWVVFVVAASIVGIEVGWIWAFRSGGSLSLTGMLVNPLAAVVVIPLGIWLFQEKLSLENVIGIVLCLAGLVLIAKR
jgi:drug/metabolite transporter (DMT)-like permease